MSAQVGQPVQYFDSRGYGPFAATILAVDEGSPATEATEDSEATAATPASVSLEYTKVSNGTVTRTFRKGIVELGSEAHDAATAAIPEGAEVCGLPKKARGFKAVA